MAVAVHDITTDYWVKGWNVKDSGSVSVALTGLDGLQQLPFEIESPIFWEDVNILQWLVVDLARGQRTPKPVDDVVLLEHVSIAVFCGDAFGVRVVLLYPACCEEVVTMTVSHVDGLEMLA